MIEFENTKPLEVQEIAFGLSPVAFVEMERELNELSDQIETNNAQPKLRSFTEAVIARDGLLPCNQRNYKGSYIRLKSSLARSPLIV